jgi:ribose transport system permease protein
MAATLEQSISQRTHKSTLSWLASRQVFWVCLAAILACVVLSLATETFATERNLFNVTRNFAFVGIIAIGMTAVIVTCGIDL